MAVGRKRNPGQAHVRTAGRVLLGKPEEGSKAMNKRPTEADAAKRQVVLL